MGKWNAPSRIITPSDYFLEVKKGNVAGVEIIKKFGHSNTIGTTYQPIAFGNTYPMPAAAVSLEIVSGDAADNVGGIGAHEITIIGLAADWTEQIVTVIPNGLTPVAIAGTWLRVYRAYVSSSGTYADISTGSHQGDLTIRIAGAGAIYAVIDSADYPIGQTQIAAYSVPINKTAYIGNIVMTVDAAKVIDVIGFRRPNANDVTTPYSGAMRVFVDTHGLQNIIPLDFHSPYGPFEGPCDLGFMARVTSGTHAAAISFEIYLMDD